MNPTAYPANSGMEHVPVKKSWKNNKKEKEEVK
jgi:hypothetical protein